MKKFDKIKNCDPNYLVVNSSKNGKRFQVQFMGFNSYADTGYNQQITGWFKTKEKAENFITDFKNYLVNEELKQM